MLPRLEERTYAVVLAAGDGSRLAALTRALYGEHVPKQFAILSGARSLLQTTVERIGQLIPPQRTVVVVSQHHEALARHQLAPYRGIDIVAQPANLGTGPGLLLPLARVRARCRDAHVAVFPSDHHFANPEPVVAGVRSLLHALDSGRFPLALLGVEPRRPDAGYGWIERGAALEGEALTRIERFVEKPPGEVAARLFAAGALWNTLICVGRLADLWPLLCRHLPGQTSAFERYVASAGSEGAAHLLHSLYRDMAPANLSHDVLSRARDLAVLRVAGAGFYDWGTPESVLESLAGTPAHDRLLDRISGRSVAVA